MAIFSPQNHHFLACFFGIAGNVVSFFVYLAPLKTFYRIWKRKSTEGFQAVPYSVSLFSAMLMLYYAFLKKHALMLYTINSIGCGIESIYLFVFLIYATRSARVYTTKFIVFFNVIIYGLIVLSTYLLPEEELRLKVVGWINVVFSVCVFASPLSIMRLVVKTKSVEFMPFLLSFFLTLCAIMWFSYGFLIRDMFIAAPNVLGFLLGIAQMLLYILYKDAKKTEVLPECKLQVLDIDGKMIEQGIILQEDPKSINGDLVQVEVAKIKPLAGEEADNDCKV